MWLHKNKERRKAENKLKRKRIDETQKEEVRNTLTSAREKTKDVDERIEELRRIARLGNT